MKIEVDYIEKLLELFTQNGLTELTVEESDKALVIKKECGVVSHNIIPQTAPVATSAVPSTVTSQVVSPEIKTEKKPEAQGKSILSPMIGTFYKAASPDSKPFVSVGDTVAPGQVVCIIEAMKLMNEIESEVSGKITQICVSDGEPVEYGQVLMYVE